MYNYKIEYVASLKSRGVHQILPKIFPRIAFLVREIYDGRLSQRNRLQFSPVSSLVHALCRLETPPTSNCRAAGAINAMGTNKSACRK